MGTREADKHKHYSEDWEDGYIEGLKNGQDWIPVSVRLPKEDGKYLVTFAGFYEPVVTIAEIERDETFSLCLGWVGMDGIHYPLDMITAWMPLPYPYAGDDWLAKHMNPPEESK